MTETKDTQPEPLAQAPEYTGTKPQISMDGAELSALLKNPDLTITTIQTTIATKLAEVVVETTTPGEEIPTLRSLVVEKLRGDTPGYTYINGTNTVIPIDPGTTYYMDSGLHQKLTETTTSKGTAMYARMDELAAKNERKAQEAARKSKETPPPTTKEKASELTQQEKLVIETLGTIIEATNDLTRGNVVINTATTRGGSQIIEIQKPNRISHQDWFRILKSEFNQYNISITILEQILTRSQLFSTSATEKAIYETARKCGHSNLVQGKFDRKSSKTGTIRIEASANGIAIIFIKH